LVGSGMIAVGETVGNYRVTAKLGEGGMGQVFLAQHPVIGSKVAIKAVHSRYARNPEVVSRFVTEARAVNQVGHDHIVDITDFGTTPAGDFYTSTSSWSTCRGPCCQTGSAGHFHPRGR
jgi:serine/threonine-protein kinase